MSYFSISYLNFFKPECQAETTQPDKNDSYLGFLFFVLCQEWACEIFSDHKNCDYAIDIFFSSVLPKVHDDRQYLYFIHSCVARTGNSVSSVSLWLVALAIPKSITFVIGLPSCSVTITLEGLISRWI